MDKLTDKQRANRAYYANNAEKIRAKKRASYAASMEGKPKLVKQRVQPVVKRVVDRSKPVHKKHNVTPEDKTKMEARRRLEDLKIAKELGIESLDYIIEDGDRK